MICFGSVLFDETWDHASFFFLNFGTYDLKLIALDRFCKWMCFYSQLKLF